MKPRTMGDVGQAVARASNGGFLYSYPKEYRLMDRPPKLHTFQIGG